MANLTRTLKDGSTVPAIDMAVELKVVTKCPTKWLLIDQETGVQYKGQLPQDGGLHWKRIEE
jgi:hypothetical protein